MTLFPMFLKLEGRACLVVGAGNVGEPKIRSLLDANANVRVVAPTATGAVGKRQAAQLDRGKQGAHGGFPGPEGNSCPYLASRRAFLNRLHQRE